MLGCGWRCFYRNESFAVRNRVDLDYIYRRAIIQEIGERLRASLKPEPELPARLRTQINRLRELEESAHRQSFPVPSIGKNLAVEPKMARTDMDEQCHR